MRSSPAGRIAKVATSISRLGAPALGFRPVSLLRPLPHSPSGRSNSNSTARARIYSNSGFCRSCAREESSIR
jgi:hypothetical protein